MGGRGGGISRQMVSRLERGLVDSMTVGDLRSIGRALDMPSIIRLGWRGPEVDRLRDREHAALVEAFGRVLVEAGWELVPEYTFSHYGEKGSVDGLAWHAAGRALLIAEIETRIWDVQDLLSTLDRKRRLVPDLLRRERGWQADSVGVVLVMEEKSTHRHLIARHSATFGAAFPQRQAEVLRWIAEPSGSLRGILFLPNSHQTNIRKPGTDPKGRKSDRPTRKTPLRPQNVAPDTSELA